MNSILRAMRYQADFNLTAASASGANLLLAAVQNGDVAEARRGIESLVHLLRLSHIRQRYAEPLPEPESRSLDLIAALHRAHPDISVRDALYCRDVLAREGVPGEGMKLWARTGHPQSSLYKPDEDKEREESERRERIRRETEHLKAELREEEVERDGEIESGEIESDD